MWEVSLTIPEYSTIIKLDRCMTSSPSLFKTSSFASESSVDASISAELPVVTRDLVVAEKSAFLECIVAALGPSTFDYMAVAV